MAIHTKDTDDFYSICAQIDYVPETVFGIAVKPPQLRHMGGRKQASRAVAALGCNLYRQTSMSCRAKHKDAATPARSCRTSLASERRRWGVVSVYLRTDFYARELLAGEMMMEVRKKKIDNIAYRAFGDSPETNPPTTPPAVESIRGVWRTGETVAVPCGSERILPNCAPICSFFPSTIRIAEKVYSSASVRRSG